MNNSWKIYPGGPHVPGQNSRPPENAEIQALLAELPAQIIADDWCHIGAYQQGLAFFEAGFFWEAHEVWEAVWVKCAPNSREKYLLQGLIQVANACLKVRMRRKRGALKLAQEASMLIREAFLSKPDVRVMGVSFKDITAELDGFTAKLEVEKTTEEIFPQINLLI
ncbi:MAG: DUF309 domain-containing protein [Sneathiella sp.]